jgi:3-methyladenine DNA glycosylase AlkD
LATGTACFSVDRAAQALEAQLRSHGDPLRARQEQRYLKSQLTFLGVGVPVLRKTAKAFVRSHPELRRTALLALVKRLWDTPIYELRAVAVGILELKQAQLRASDMPVLIALVRDAKTWALVDWLAIKVLGAILVREPRARRYLERWARDEDFWVRRSALLCWHDPLLAGGGDFAHFAQLATPLLGEREFFIRKAIGWVLRSTAKRTPQRTYDFVAQHAGQMSGLTFREATRNLAARQIKALTALRARARVA